MLSAIVGFGVFVMDSNGLDTRHPVLFPGPWCSYSWSKLVSEVTTLRGRQLRILAAREPGGEQTQRLDPALSSLANAL